MESNLLAPIDVANRLSEKTGIPLEQVKSLLQAQAEMAYAEARAGFPIPGIGVLGVIDTPERKMVMLFGPKQGQEVVLPPKKRLRFRMAREALDAVFGPPGPAPNAFDMTMDGPISDRPED